METASHLLPHKQLCPPPSCAQRCGPTNEEAYGLAKLVGDLDAISKHLESSLQAGGAFFGDLKGPVIAKSSLTYAKWYITTPGGWIMTARSLELDHDSIAYDEGEVDQALNKTLNGSPHVTTLPKPAASSMTGTKISIPMLS